MPLTPGTKLAHYEVVESIGAGGMGEVYRARDTKLGRDVAIKALPEEFARDKDRLDRFEREARLLAQLNHANIATLHGLEEHDGQKFLVMELVEGETLAERIAQGPLPVDEAIPLFIQIAEGLEAAHEKGIIHRDLKPANIKIGPDGKPKILDFGLAKAFVGNTEAAPDSSQSPTLTKGTALGAIMGTAAYMSPEQARGKSVDRRTDVWAFGCCLFEALTGQPAFVGETVSETIARVLEREPVWDALPKATPTALATLLKRCVRKDLNKRVHDIADVRIELQDLPNQPEEPSAPLTVANRKSTLAVALVAGIALGLALASLLRPSVESVRVVRSAIALDPAAELALSPATPALAVSPDGHRIAFLGGPASSRRLYIRSLDERAARVVDGSAGAYMPFFSPDGNWVGFYLNRTLMKVSVSGGAPISIIDSGEEESNPRGASWGSDGWIVYNRSFSSGLSRVRDDGGEPQVLTTPDLSKREKTHRFPDVLPGGKAVLFTLGSVDIPTFDEASIAVLDLETLEYRVLLEGGTSPRFSSTGHIVYARDGELLAVPFDIDALEIRGPSSPVVAGVATSPLAGNAEFALSRNGSLIYQPGSSWGDDDRVVWVDRGGRVAPLIDALGAYDQEVRLSPDGQALAVWIDGANSSVWIYDIPRGTLGRLSSSSFTNNNAVWAPGGERLAFRSDRGGGLANLYIQARTGTGQAKRLTDSTYIQDPGSWSPDGKLVAFDELRPLSGYDIWTVNVSEDQTTTSYIQTEFNERAPSFSSDGRWIAYQSDATGRDEIYIGPFPASTNQWQVSTEGGVEPRWRSDGDELFYRNGRKMMAVEVRTGTMPILGKPVMLFETSEGIGDAFDVAPDGQRFVMIDESRDPPPALLNLVQNWAEELKRLVPTN